MLHFTEGGKHTEGQDTTNITVDVTCGNCKRTKAFQRAAKMVADAALTGNTIHALNDAGFFIGGTFHYRNCAIGADFFISYVAGSIIGVDITSEGHETAPQSFGGICAFLAWITPKDSAYAIECVLNDGMTWVEAMDHVHSLRAEVESVRATERAVNDASTQAILDRLAAINAAEEPIREQFRSRWEDTRGVRTVQPLQRPTPREPIQINLAECVREYRAAHPLIAEDIASVPRPFRTASKVKNTRQARRYRKGA